MILKKNLSKKITTSQIGGNRWIDHVKKIQSQNKNLTYKEVLVLAKKSYTKNKVKKTAKGTHKWRDHVKKVMSQNKNLKFKDILSLAKKSYKK